MKDIILASGSGTRLYLLMMVMRKQLLHIYCKLMIYYSLDVLMMTSIHDILIISTLRDLSNFERLLVDGSQCGVNFSHTVRSSANGLVQLFPLDEKFIVDVSRALVLRNNIFYGNGPACMLRGAVRRKAEEDNATAFGYYVDDSKRYHVADHDENNRAVLIEEKPAGIKSNCVVTGRYYYDGWDTKFAEQIKLLPQCELGITHLNYMCLEGRTLNVCILKRGYVRLDTGLMGSLCEACESLCASREARAGPARC